MNMDINKPKEVNHNDPSNPYWVISTLALEVVDVFVQTFRFRKNAQKFALKRYKKKFVYRQVYICKREDSNLVIGSIDMLNGLYIIVDYTDPSEPLPERLGL